MTQITTLADVLQPILQWHRARLMCFAAIVLALLQLRSVNLAALAQLINPRRSVETNYRRLQRFFALFAPDPDTLTRLLLALRPHPEAPITLVMDRTEWSLGKRRVNLLMVGYRLDGFVIPLRWRELEREGNSNFYDRRAVLAPLLAHIDPAQIEALVADREFIGTDFFAWMQEHGLRFVIRIRKNARLRTDARRSGPPGERAGDRFKDLAVGEARYEDWHVYRYPLHVVAAREGEEPWLLVTNGAPAQALRLYGERWSIETTFAALKRRGFDLASTHLVASERIERLLGVLAVALVWAVKVGLWQEALKPTTVKKHGRRAISYFRCGLRYLRRSLLLDDRSALEPAFRVLSCT